MDDFQKNIDFGTESLYYRGNSTANGVVELTVKELVTAAFRSARVSQVEGTARINWVPQQLSSRLSRGSLRLSEFLELMDAIGIDVQLVNRKTGELVKAHIPGEGRRVSQVVDGVAYDTAKCDALANNFFADGENKYSDGVAMELYRDIDGRYFLAEYTSLAGVKDRIVPVTAEDAAAFIKKYQKPATDSAAETE